MIDSLLKLPIAEKIKILEQLWDSIAEEQDVLPINKAQQLELDKRLGAYETERRKGRPAAEPLADIRRHL